MSGQIRMYHPIHPFKHIDVEFSSFRSLLKIVAKDGKGQIFDNADRKDLKQIQEFAKFNLGSFHDTYKRFLNPHIYKVGLSEELATIKCELLGKAR